MSVRVRLALLLALAVATSLFIAWFVTRRAVIAPFAREVLEAHLDQVTYVADELEKGGDAAELGRRLGLDIRVRHRPPRFVRRKPRRDRPHPRCEERTHRERHLFVCRGRLAPAAVETTVGWVVVRRDLDVEQPQQRVGWVLLAIAGFVILVAIYAATIATRPLRTTVGAMERMAGGDLSHRLPETGGRELAEVAHAFNKMADRVDALLRTERELMAGISHELRTPLARLRLELEMLRDHEVPSKRIDAMEEDLAEVDRLIGELLEMSRLQLGERTLERAPLNIRDIVDEALQRHPLPKHELTIEGEGGAIRGDRPRLVRLVQNLLQNANKYAPRGTKVTIVLEGTSFEIRDEGPGVPPEDLARLFEPFYRSPGGKKSATGLGLGLMIARQVVDLHGGHITARNLDPGLAIRVELPAAPTA